MPFPWSLKEVLSTWLFKLVVLIRVEIFHPLVDLFSSSYFSSKPAVIRYHGFSIIGPLSAFWDKKIVDFIHLSELWIFKRRIKINQKRKHQKRLHKHFILFLIPFWFVRSFDKSTLRWTSTKEEKLSLNKHIDSTLYLL